MPRFFKHIIGIMLVILIAGCAGGGCSSGCSGCGITPLPGGFEPTARIENAASVRLTDSGITFLEQNLGPLAKAALGDAGGAGGVIKFPIPESSISLGITNGTVCPGGPDENGNPPKCVAEIDIGNAKLNIDTATPHNIKITGPLPIRLQNLPINLGFLGTTNARLTSNGCSTPSAFTNVDLDVDISVEVDNDPTHARYGYSRVKINKLAVNEAQLQNSLEFCGGFIGSVLDLLKGLVFGLISDQLLGTLGDTLSQQLCQQADPMANPPCPAGSNDVEGVCRYGTDAAAECVGILLGTEGRLDLSGALASISPGTTGGLDILFAVGGPSKRPDNSNFAWGDLNPIANGATLGMYGGGEASPISGCVKLSEMALPTGIPVPLELEKNTVDGWPAGLAGPHVGIGLSERYANYALNSVYNSGFLCLGISTETVPQLASGTLSLLASSLKDLGLQREAQQVALVIRPGKPPTATFGNGTDINTDPVIRVLLPQASFDFYIWSTDRFIRFMTATFDLDVPVNLAVTPDGLLPVLDKIGVSNGKVTNSELLREDPVVIAGALQGLLGGLAGQFLGGISAIDLSSALSSLGLTLTIPESVDGQGSPGLRKLTRDTDNYLGIFATLGTAAQNPFAPNKTTVTLVKKDLDREGFRLASAVESNVPAVNIQLSSPLDNGTQAIEYSYRVDQGAWKPFTRERMVTVRDEWLRLQGKHTISARSRVVGHPETMDETPATMDVVIDAEPPVITIGEPVEAKAVVEVRDVVTGGGETRMRYRLDVGDWSAWTNAADIKTIDVGDAAEITVEAEDAEGNVAQASQALIRGRAIATGAGCGCTFAGEDQSQTNAAWVFALGMLGTMLRIARRRSDKPFEVKQSSGPKVRATTGSKSRRALRTLTSLAVIGATGSFCVLGCSDDSQIVVNSYKCVDPCVDLVPGLIGAYTSVATTDRTIWVAGYAEADWSSDYSWGDLVVGKWDGTAAKVAWSAIDGVPAEPPPDPLLFNKNGFRGGQVESGDDVGLWTSIAVGSEGQAAVAYYDRTNKALKFAQQEGSSWNIMTVEGKPQADIGRYAKLLVVGGKPTIAYLSIEPGSDGAVSSKVRLATATSAKPAGAADWTFEDVAVDAATPCRAFFCAGDTACVIETNKCEKKQTSCEPKCASGSACVDTGGGAACADIRDASKIDTYPEAAGAYIALATDPAGALGVAFYDRIKGNLVVASKASGSWVSTIIDGQADDGTDNGDVGIGASLFIDEKGDWHISYADGLSEGLKYAQVTKGTTVKLRAIVDDGLTLDGVKFDDGQHIVGDDSSIYVGPSGEIHISYQDASSGTLRHAVGTPTGDQITWKTSVISQEGFAGAFSHVFISDGKLMIANWWRMGGDEVKGDVNIVSP